MADRAVEFTDGQPPIGEQYRFVASPLGKGFLAPYIAFDPKHGDALARAKRLCVTTGLMPMALIIPASEKVIASSMYTHDTPYTLALTAMWAAEARGVLLPGTYAQAAADMMSGNVEVISIGLDTNEGDQET